MMHISNLSGQQLGPYTLERILGTGGMGTVYEALQPSLKRKVAIKVLLANPAQTPDYLERFNREVEIAANLEHPHILPVHDYGVDQGVSYVVMRLMSAGTLEERI